MSRTARLANNRPWVFASAVTLILIAMVFISFILMSRWPAESTGFYLAGTLSRIVFTILMLAVIWRLGWLRPAGFTRIGRWQTWLLIPLPLAYAVGITAFAFSGRLDFRPGDPLLTAVVTLFIFAAAFLEEVAFRGLVLHAFTCAREKNSRGPIKAVAASAFFFGLMHMVNVLGGVPLAEGLLQSAVGFLLGIFLGVLVLHGGSIYPAFAFHGVLNWMGYLNLASTGAQGTPSAWLLLSVLTMPLALLGLAILYRLPRRREVAASTANL